MLRFLVAAAFCGSRLAFSQDLPSRVEEPRREEAQAEQAQAAARKDDLGLKDKEPSYDDVLARPDDVDVNYRYALSQIRKGNLRAAAATLERVLIVAPDAEKARLLYAVVLFRLDDLDDAERELRLLEARPMPASLRAELEDYLRQIRLRRRRTHESLLLGAGFDYDDNRNAAPASGQRLFFGTPIVLDENSTRKSDTAATMLGSLSLSHDLGYQEGHRVFADYTYFRAEQFHQRILNLQNHAIDAGGMLRTRWLDVTPSLEFDHLLLTQTTYLRSRGARLRLERRVTPRLGLLLESAYVRQEYNRTLIVADGDDRTGDRLEGSGGASWSLTPTMSVLGSYTHVQQGALAKFDAFQRESVSVSHSWLLGRGSFLLSSFILNLDRYERANPVVGRDVRRDETYRGRVSCGVALTWLARALEDFTFTLSYEYYQAVSNLRNYSYSNNRVSGLWTYKWER